MRRWNGSEGCSTIGERHAGPAATGYIRTIVRRRPGVCLTFTRWSAIVTTSNAEATWEGGLKTGKGSFRAESGAFESSYSFSSRFESTRGSSPEELIAAAHAACISMALSGGLEQAGTPPTRITTKAACTVEKAADGFRITRMRLVLRGVVPGVNQSAFKAAAEAALNGCPVSNALKNNVAVELDAALE